MYLNTGDRYQPWVPVEEQDRVLELDLAGRGRHRGTVTLLTVSGTDPQSVRVEVNGRQQLRFVTRYGDVRARTFWFDPPTEGGIRLGIRNQIALGFYQFVATPGGQVGYLPSVFFDRDQSSHPALLSLTASGPALATLGLSARELPGLPCRCARTWRGRPASTCRGAEMRILFLSWRDTGHPDGGGSEEYIEHVAERLAGPRSRGHDPLRGVRRAPGVELRRGVRFLRRGQRLTVYPRGLLWACSEPGGVPRWSSRSSTGSPSGRAAATHGTVPLVHHLHREQWQMIYPGWRGRVGWLIERLTIRAYRGCRS